jgi:hypothetical protein
LTNNQAQETEQLQLIEALVDGMVNKEISEDDPTGKVAKLEGELEVVRWIMELHRFAHQDTQPNYSPIGDLSQLQLWQNIDDHYHEISNGLAEQFYKMEIMADLVSRLKPTDIRNSWKEPSQTRGWWDGINYSDVNKTNKKR